MTVPPTPPPPPPLFSFIWHLMDRTTGYVFTLFVINIIFQTSQLTLIQVTSFRCTHNYSDFLSQTFREGWKSFLPNPGGFFNVNRSSESYDNLIGNFLNHLIINASVNFSTSEFVQSITNATTNLAVNLLSVRDMTIKNCIKDRLVVNESASSNMAIHLDMLRSCITALVNSEQFLINYSQNDSFKFPPKCANELISISFCGRCNSTFPPLCSKTCGALIRACYSPYYDALPKEFNLLWNVSIQVLHILNTTLQDLFTEGTRLFNDVSMVSTMQLRLSILHTTILLCMCVGGGGGGGVPWGVVLIWLGYHQDSSMDPFKLGGTHIQYTMQHAI